MASEDCNACKKGTEMATDWIAYVHPHVPILAWWLYGAFYKVSMPKLTFLLD